MQNSELLNLKTGLISESLTVVTDFEKASSTLHVPLLPMFDYSTYKSVFVELVKFGWARHYL
jgi:hypothetical protein